MGIAIQAQRSQILAPLHEQRSFLFRSNASAGTDVAFVRLLLSDRPLYRYGYTKAAFELVECEYDRGARGHRTGIARRLTAWANKHKDKYEERYAFLYPMLQVDFTLRAIK